MTFVQIQLPPSMAFMEEASAWKHGKLLAMVTKDEGRWHLSVSHRDRTPTWDEVSKARRQLLPADLHFCIPHPPEKFWVNLHPYCLHLWEVRDEALTGMWEADGEAAKAAGFGKPDW